MASLPYAQTTSTLESILEKIKTASVPEKFSQDFVSTKLMIKGGNGRSIIPFIKKWDWSQLMEHLLIGIKSLGIQTKKEPQ